MADEEMTTGQIAAAAPEDVSDKKKKKKKKKKSKETSESRDDGGVEVDRDGTMSEAAPTSATSTSEKEGGEEVDKATKKKDKKKKKKDKKRKESKSKGEEKVEDSPSSTVEGAEDNAAANDSVSGPPDDDASAGSNKEVDMEGKDKEERRKDRKRKLEDRKSKKESLLEKVPKVDEHGIAYTKLQIRRMLKRVKRGLPPVPTEEEERERIRMEKEERKLEEQELAGMIYDKSKKEAEEDAKMEKEDDDGEENESDDEGDGEDVSEKEHETTTEDKNTHDEPSDECQPTRRKKARRNKPVPADYTCMACNNKHSPAHWIYDCPDKKTVRGTNQVAKNMRGIHQPDAKKVFVSGLPFEIKQKDVVAYFEEKGNCGKVSHCKLLTFEDSERCKGQAFLTFKTEEGAKKALKMSGSIIEFDTSKKDKKGGKKKGGDDKSDGSEKKKVLRLKVSKVQNRALTQGKKAANKSGQVGGKQ